MGRRLPSLNALRAFEAAARHLSFTKAAEELNVTQAAISHQIKGLEEGLGILLFRRVNRGLLLTEAGQTYLPALRDAFDQIAEATHRLKVADSSGTLTVSTTASFAAGWLLPRLPRFQRRLPDIDVRLSTSSQLVDFATQDVDVAIRFGRGGWPDLKVERLLTEEIFPVSTPQLRDGPPPLQRVEDLALTTLLHDDFEITWENWLRAAGMTGIDATRGPRFSDTNLVVQAAVAGHGVALARGALVTDHLANGRLVRLFDLALPSDLAYYVVAPPNYFDRPKVRAFVTWLHDEATTTSAS